MTFMELVEAVAASTGQPKKLVSVVLRGCVTETKKALSAGEPVKLAGFGAFFTVEISPRPLWGKGLSRPSRVVRFKQARRRVHGQVRG